MRGARVKYLSIGLGLLVALAHANAAKADELRVFAPSVIINLLSHVGAQFERQTGYKLIVTSDVGAALVRRINGGEPFDVFAGAPPQIDSLIESGKLAAKTRTKLVRSGIGVEVRAGAPKPDLGSVAAFKQALLDAKSIGFLKEGASGVYLAGLMERLGIGDAVRPKLVQPDGDVVSQQVAKGEIALGMVLIAQILTTPGVDLAGPLPPEIQNYVTFVGGVASDSHAPDAARALLAFLTGPSVIPVLKAQGMEPG